MRPGGKEGFISTVGFIFLVFSTKALLDLNDMQMVDGTAGYLLNKKSSKFGVAKLKVKGDRECQYCCEERGLERGLERTGTWR